MRQIKFRAWHEKAKKMFSPEEMGQDELCLNPDGRGFVNVNGTSTRLSQYFPEMIPEQFTGLLDKNGKEIYEGDIVLKVKWDSIGEVHYHNGGFKLSSGNAVGNYLGHFVRDVEVIGNIHENPELGESK